MSLKAAAEMPSNIALIKYMGKVPGAARNRPTNASLSFTLESLLTRVEISELEVSEFKTDSAKDFSQDQWAPLEGDWLPPQMSDKAQERFLKHFSFLKTQWNISGRFLVKSANNFPSDCGIASSSSAFAALTMASYELAKVQNPALDLTVHDVAELSRQGSGSSIRSFLSPFVLWNEHGISKVDLPYGDLVHKVVIVDAGKKAVSSSDAHERVRTSSLFAGRAVRAEQRLTELLQALRAQDWQKAFDVTWSEFMDMHGLFTTSEPSFQYMTAKSLEVLDMTREFWARENDGPLVTMDAGANVHWLFRQDQKKLSIDLQNQLQERMREISLLGNESR